MPLYVPLSLEANLSLKVSVATRFGENREVPEILTAEETSGI